MSSGLFRIVKEKRGDTVTGIRVQEQGYRRHTEGHPGGEVWRNRGKRVYTVQDAETMKEFFMNQRRMSAPAVEYEIVGGPEYPGEKLDDYPRPYGYR